MIEMRCLKNVAIVFRNNFKFCPVKKNHITLQEHCVKYLRIRVLIDTHLPVQGQNRKVV